jgi:glycosyltransferase involved in cell wall biosynthesis
VPPYSYGFLSPYPPTHCGLANFTAELLRGLVRPGSEDRAGVVRVIGADGWAAPIEVVQHLRRDQPGGPRLAATALNRFDVAVIQHDRGLYGGPDGNQILAVLDELRVPVVLVLHAVPAAPTPRQRQVLEQAVDAAGAVVTLTDIARQRLIDGYVVDPAKVTVIPHGALQRGVRARVPGEAPMILTWGMLGPGKGIEWAIGGLRRIRELRPAAKYVISGETHPQVRRLEGEAYRLGLLSRAKALRVADMLRFQRTYLDVATLSGYIRRADVVLLPNDSHEPVVSAVLAEAVAAGKPVIAASFPHAVELLASGAGLLVPRRDGAAIGEALYRVLTEPELAAELSAAAARLAPPLWWPAVAERYRTLIDGLVNSAAPVGAGSRASIIDR